MIKKCIRVECNKEFETNNPHKVYCSDRCRKLSYEKKHRIDRIRRQRIHNKDRKEIKELSNECWFCGSKENLERHHITYIEKGDSEIIKLCRNCHSKLHICLNINQSGDNTTTD